MTELLSRSRRWIKIVLLVALIALATYPSALPLGVDQAPPPEVARRLGRLVQENTTPQGVVVSDAHWLVAWYGDRTAIWLPQTVAMLEQMEAQGLPVEAVLLTEFWVYNAAETDPTWLDLFQRPRPFGPFRAIVNWVRDDGGQTTRAVLFVKGASQ
jgi:hypothetical protein